MKTGDRPRIALLKNACLAGVLFFMASAGESGHAAPQPLDPEFGVGSWIWAEKTHDRQECRFWRSFEIPDAAVVKSARLRIAVDNFYDVFLDGQPIGQGSDWRTLIEYDLSQLLAPGSHILAVHAFNDFDVAGVLLGLRVELGDGAVIEIASDDTWKIAPNSERDWKEATKRSGAWPPAKVLYPFRREERPRIYQAPVSQPLVVAFWQKGWFQIALASASIVTAVACLFLLSRLLLKSQMEKVVGRERARIAADLHDDLGGRLTHLVLLGESTRDGVPPDSQAAGSIDRLCQQSRGLLRSMNETVWLINSQRDTLRDFASYIVKYAESFFQGTPVRCRFDVDDDLPVLACDLGVRRNLFLAVKEALNNVLRHSQADEVALKIRLRKNEIVVSVTDNGKGFDPATADRERNGLHNMKIRAADAGGQLTIDSQPGAGCKLEFRVPLDSPRRNRRSGSSRFLHPS